MGFVSVAKALLLLQLSLFFVISFAAELDDDSTSPSLAPMPASGPASGPVNAPINPFKKAVVVHGNVFTRSCNSAWRTHPVSGATIQMQCNITETPETFTAQTDERGFFLLNGPESATILEAYKCKVALGPCPSDSCSKPSLLRGGASGVPLMWPKIYRSFNLFSVGPWAYEPKCALI